MTDLIREGSRWHYHTIHAVAKSDEHGRWSSKESREEEEDVSLSSWKDRMRQVYCWYRERMTKKDIEWSPTWSWSRIFSSCFLFLPSYPPPPLFSITDETTIYSKDVLLERAVYTNNCTTHISCEKWLTVVYNESLESHPHSLCHEGKEWRQGMKTTNEEKGCREKWRFPYELETTCQVIQCHLQSWCSPEIDKRNHKSLEVKG